MSGNDILICVDYHYILVCDVGRFGRMCKGICRCRNGGLCDHVTGKCTCKSGFTGKYCRIGKIYDVVYPYNDDGS